MGELGVALGNPRKLVSHTVVVLGAAIHPFNGFAPLARKLIRREAARRRRGAVSNGRGDAPHHVGLSLHRLPNCRVKPLPLVLVTRVHQHNTSDSVLIGGGEHSRILSAEGVAHENDGSTQLSCVYQGSHFPHDRGACAGQRAHIAQSDTRSVPRTHPKAGRGELGLSR